ncbi:MAG TPA: hypothetical protein VHY34_11980 [Caulobacteraceae bacterium]|nr:hypothetical protein [Caulobacteraceae bacterium]
MNLTVRWRRSRWWRLSEDPETYTRSRTTFAWFVRAGKKIGAVRFNEIDAGMEEDNVFLLSMDDNSFSDGQLALTLCSEWRDVGFTVGCYGPIVEVAEAWIHPHFAPGGSWADVATMLLARLFADRSILVLKAFPLEYEGTTPAGSPSPTALLSRQRAMVRHYRRTLNARSLPGRPGKEGWMWLANPRCRDVLPRPKYNPRLKM